MKLVELVDAKRRLDAGCRYIADKINEEKTNGVLVCYHDHYNKPTFSIFKTSEEEVIDTVTSHSAIFNRSESVDKETFDHLVEHILERMYTAEV